MTIFLALILSRYIKINAENPIPTLCQRRGRKMAPNDGLTLPKGMDDSPIIPPCPPKAYFGSISSSQPLHYMTPISLATFVTS